MDQYPSNEFGYVEGTVYKIAALPKPKFFVDAQNEISYRVYVKIPDSMITTYCKLIPYALELDGHAKIITNDRNLFQRLIGGLFSKVQ